MWIDTTEVLARFCDTLRKAPHVCVDTEFIGERTYHPQLCLIQLGHGDDAAAVDPLARGLDLAPVAELLADASVMKVMHAGRQDLTILLRATGQLAAPLFDTQIAATVCGMGEQPGYDKVVQRVVGVEIDKSSQATDWSLRPLSERQVEYALSDVTHLSRVYDWLVAELESSGRREWVVEEMAALLDPASHRVDPDEAYRRIKLRKPSPRTLGVLRELAAWRERAAMERDLPRGWVVRDDALTEIAQRTPRERRQLARVRGLKEPIARGADGQALLDAVARGLSLDASELPAAPERGEPRVYDESLVALLQALLRLRCDEHGVAMRMVARRSELEALAADRDADIPALHGWRRQVFGADALALCAGKLALTGRDGAVVAWPGRDGE